MTDKREYINIELESGQYTTTPNRKFTERKPWVAINPKNVVSFMPGSIVELRVKVGDTVKKGQSLMLFKAMKMHNNILAPMDGKVKAIYADLGVNIPKNTVMLELE